MQDPVLFLDFDGVCHALDTAALDEDFKVISNPKLFEWLPILTDILEPFPNVKIIISSDWRRLFDDDSLIQILGPLGERFMGVVESRGSNRADEIRLEVTRRKLTRWVAIDDHASVVETSKTGPQFIACQPNIGLSSPSVQLKLRVEFALTV